MNYLTIKHSIPRARGLTAGLLAALLLTACVTTPVPPTEALALASAEDAIITAEQAEARQYAEAELEDARARLVLAKKAVEAEDMTRAEYLALESRITAELALARTEAIKTDSINREMKRSAEALEEEMQRQGDKQ